MTDSQRRCLKVAEQVASECLLACTELSTVPISESSKRTVMALLMSGQVAIAQQVAQMSANSRAEISRMDEDTIMKAIREAVARAPFSDR